MFFSFANEELFLFLLDGFDEISSEFDKQVRASAMLKLSPLLSTRSKVLLTCRPNYFVNIDEYNSILREVNVLGESLIKVTPRYPSVAAEARLQLAQDLQRKLVASYQDNRRPKRVNPVTAGTIFLNPLTEKQIIEYLRKRHQEFDDADIDDSPGEILEFLRGIYDISDLMTRPILLGMICDTIVWGVIRIVDKNIKIGASRLYEIYTNTCFVRDCDKAGIRTSPSPEQRGQFSEVLAVAMLLDQGDSVPFSRLVEIAQELKQSPQGDDWSNLTVEQLAEAIRYTTFLEHVGGGRFSFKHYSFMEFFCARWIKNAFSGAPQTDRLDPFSDRALKDEILYFLGNFAVEEAELVARWSELLKLSTCGGAPIDEGSPSDVLCQRNALGALLFAGAALRRKRIVGGHVWDVRAERVRLDEVHFNKIRLSRMKLPFLTASLAGIEGGVFRDCEFIKCRLQQCRWGVEASKTVFDETFATSCDLALDGNENVLRSCTFESCQISLKGTANIEGGKFERSEVYLDAGEYRINDTCFESCDLIQIRHRGATNIDVRLGTRRSGRQEIVTTQFFGCNIWCLTVGPNVIASAVRDQEKGGDSLVQRGVTVRTISVPWLSNSKGLILVGGGGLRGRDFDRYNQADLESVRAGRPTDDQRTHWTSISYNAMRFSTDGVLFADSILFQNFKLFRGIVHDILLQKSSKLPEEVQRNFFG